MSKLKKGILSTPSGKTGSIITYQRLGKSIVTGPKSDFSFQPNSGNNAQWQKLKSMSEFYKNLPVAFRNNLDRGVIDSLSQFNIFMKFNKDLVNDDLSYNYLNLSFAYAKLADPQAYVLQQNPFTEILFFRGVGVSQIGLNPSNYWVILYNYNHTTGVQNPTLIGTAGESFIVQYNPIAVPSGQVITQNFQLFDPVTGWSSRQLGKTFTKR